MGPQKNEEWRKSSYSATGGQSCVLVRFADGMAQVRDSKVVDGPVLEFNRLEWEMFLLGAFAGEFEMPL